MQDRNRTPIDYQKAPPYLITAQDIDRAYSDKELQNTIRDRFEMTIALDNRYRVMALIVALASIETRASDSSFTDGFNVRWIRNEALSWWQEGFQGDSSFEQARILLDEMVGLGVLRQSGPDSYALRSANILRLLGSHSEIEEKLADAATGLPPAIYEASAFRRSLDGGQHHLSPLTAEQEAVLVDRANGVCVVAGCYLSHLEHLWNGLSALAAHDIVVTRISNVTSLTGFERQLETMDKAKQQGLTIVFVDAAWERQWVQSACKFVARKTSSRKSFIRVVFPADPGQLWEWLMGRDDKLNVSELELRPWKRTTIRRWLDDNDFGAAAIAELGLKEIERHTGGWSRNMDELYEACNGDHHQWRHALEANAQPQEVRAAIVQNELPPMAARAINKVCEWGNDDVDASIIADLVEGVDVDHFIEWTEKLGWLHRSSEPGQYRLDEIVRRSMSEATI